MDIMSYMCSKRVVLLDWIFFIYDWSLRDRNWLAAIGAELEIAKIKTKFFKLKYPYFWQGKKYKGI